VVLVAVAVAAVEQMLQNQSIKTLQEPSLLAVAVAAVELVKMAVLVVLVVHQVEVMLVQLDKQVQYQVVVLVVLEVNLHNLDKVKEELVVLEAALVKLEQVVVQGPKDNKEASKLLQVQVEQQEKLLI
jgi:hypothetical protein